MLEKTLQEVNLGVPIEVIDIDNDPTLATEFKVRGVPTLVLVEDNIEKKRLVGNKTKQELEAFVND
jgi:thioredoxin-like negative regulator of GroEL